MPGRRVIGFAAVSALVLVAAAARAAGIDSVIGHRSATGHHATATAYAETGRVNELPVHVTATPNQRATGFWGWSCKVGVSMGDRDAADFARRTPFTVKMRRPLASLPTAPYTCQVEARARLAGRGRVNVQLLAG